MIKEFKLITLDLKPADAQNKYPKVVAKVEMPDGTQHTGYASQGNWNKHWVVGALVKADITEKVSAAGRPYLILGCPPELKQQSGGFTAESTRILVMISNQLKDIYDLLKENQKFTTLPSDDSNEKIEVEDLPPYV